MKKMTEKSPLREKTGPETVVRQRLQRDWQSVRQRETKMCHSSLQLAAYYTH